MSLTTRVPLRLIGGVVNSGFPATNEVMWTRGGMQTATIFSGGLLSPGSGFIGAGVKVADHVLLASGAGRLNTVVNINAQLALSGVSLVFYDSAVPALSGPNTFTNSGYRVLASINGPQGQSGQFLTNGPIHFDMPYTSGLCVCATSGVTGFSASWVPETNIPST